MSRDAPWWAARISLPPLFVTCESEHLPGRPGHAPRDETQAGRARTCMWSWQACRKRASHTSLKPFCSKRAMIFETRPRWTPSGLIMIKVRSRGIVFCTQMRSRAHTHTHTTCSSLYAQPCKSERVRPFLNLARTRNSTTLPESQRHRHARSQASRTALRLHNRHIHTNHSGLCIIPHSRTALAALAWVCTRAWEVSRKDFQFGGSGRISLSTMFYNRHNDEIFGVLFKRDCPSLFNCPYFLSLP